MSSQSQSQSPEVMNANLQVKNGRHQQIITVPHNQQIMIVLK